jgi:hypothetical protein
MVHPVLVPQAQPFAVRPEIAGHCTRLYQAFADQVVPGLGFLRRLSGTADHKPCLGAGQRDIEQPQRLLRLADAFGLLRGLFRVRSIVRAGFPSHRAARQFEQFRLVIRRLVERIGQDHDRRLQALGAMHRHDAHQILAALQLPFHDDIAIFEPVEKAGQRRGLDRFVPQRLAEQASSAS